MRVSTKSGYRSQILDIFSLSCHRLSIPHLIHRVLPFSASLVHHAHTKTSSRHQYTDPVLTPVTSSYWLVHVPAISKNDCVRCQWTMHATIRWRNSDRRMYGSPFVWPCVIALASTSTDDSQIFHGLTYLAQPVIT
ncbi:hypothetical protein P692DRAFT_20332293 [Suillus brevipes Sb2]|nr:hypothetical protein P692DRAFT_20332293 [Suillus brevipes Sb2]